MAPQFSVDIVKFWHTGLSSKICLGCAVWLHSMVTQCQELQGEKRRPWSHGRKNTRPAPTPSCMHSNDRLPPWIKFQAKQVLSCLFHMCAKYEIRSTQKNAYNARKSKHMRFFFLMRLLNTFWCEEHYQSLCVCVCGVRYLSLSGNACKWKWYCWIRAQWQSREELALGTWLGWR